MLVEFVEVDEMVSVVAALGVFDDRGNPNCVKAHSLDVVETLNYPFVVSPTVLGKVTVRGVVPALVRESVSQKLIDCSLLPLFFVMPGGGTEETRKKKHKNEKKKFSRHLRVLNVVKNNLKTNIYEKNNIKNNIKN